MDDFLDKELRQRLARDPFPGGGFDERLKRKIEERLDGSSRQRGFKARSRQIWMWPAAALVSFSILLMAVWVWGSGQKGISNLAESLQSVPANVAAEMNSFVSDAGEKKKYALLLGLRTDSQTSAGFPVSQYRTLLIAEDQEPERLRLAAELPGLYVPYGQHFWQIDAANGPGGRQILQAMQATGVSAYSRPAADFSDARLSEQVAYAGNAYLAIHTFYRDEKGEVAVLRRIRHIEQLNEKAAHPENDPFTAPDVFMPEVRQNFKEWIIYRNPGAWVSELYDPDSEESLKLSAIPQAIVQHDSLNLSWEEIQKTAPAARDAFTYGNLLGIVTDREIQVHAVRGRSPAADPVRIPLSNGEQVVMIQWAQNDKIDYVEKWSQVLRALAGGS